MARSRVGAAGCGSYRPREVNRAIAQLLESLEPLDLPKGGRILLKPNCLSANAGPEEPVNTRAEVVEAVGRYLVEAHSARLVIADSGGLGSYGRSQKTYRNMGLDRVAQGLGADLVNLERMGLVEVTSPRGQILSSFQATALLEEVEGIVNLPKMKTHLLTGMTGAVKNFLGLLPGSLKRAVHVQAPSAPAMSSALVDIFAGIKARYNPILHVMDGITAMEGQGPGQGEPREVGLLLASADAVALDWIASKIMGIDPSKIETTTLARRAGLGRGEPEGIELTGADWESLARPGFRLPSTLLQRTVLRLLPRSLGGRIFDRLNEARPRPIQANCRECGLCVEACPMGALSLTRAGLVLSREDCIECYCCVEHCAHEGLRVPDSMRERFFGFGRSA